MEASPPPPPATNLSTHLYYQLVYTLTDLLPPPLDDTPEALRTRNLAALAKVAALLPVNADEADLAAQCIAARAQAEDILRLLRQHADDIAVVMRLNAQYGSMLRTSLSLHGRLMRVQALRQKREAIEGAANQDEWTQHIAERSMVGIVDPAAGLAQPAWPEVAPATSPERAPATSPGRAPATSPEGTPVATQPTLPECAPAACGDQRTEKNVSYNRKDSQDTAFETWLSAQMPETMAKSPSAGRSLPAKFRKSPGTADYGHHIDGETASTSSAYCSASPMSFTAGSAVARRHGCRPASA
jgi:hypothetical protein